MSQYAFTHESSVFTPDGRINIAPDQIDAFNREQEARELAALQEHPDKATLYCKLAPQRQDMARITYTNQMTLSGSIQTWTGTVIDARAWFGPRRYIGYNGAYRRAVTCTLFGAADHAFKQIEHAIDTCPYDEPAVDDGGREEVCE